MKKTIYAVSVSGGKDSQAAWNYILKKYSHKGIVIPYFADTGWEAEDTYEHLRYLEKALNSKLNYISSDKYKNFEDMCVKKKAFPSRVKRFCTEELKIIPSTKFIRQLQRRGYKVINIVGVRKDESASIYLKEPIIKNGVNYWMIPKRDSEGKYKTSFLGTIPVCTKRKDGSLRFPKRAKYFYTKQNSVTTFQPIIDWSTREVLEYNILSGTKNNPLYAKGLTRVGCFPCINANKHEIGLLPPHIAQRVRDLESAVQAITIKTKPVFLHKGGELKEFIHYFNKYQYNSLGLDLGCINQLGICE